MILIPVQIFVGDLSGLKVHEEQPIKTAAMEGLWETQNGAPLLLFAWPSNKEQRNLFEIGIPKGASLINTHKLDGHLQGLKSVSPEDQPPVWLVFYSFRIMVAIGLAMLIYALVSIYMMARNRLFGSRLMLQISKYTAPIGFIAIIAGWFTAEEGRQPWVIYNLLKVQDAVANVSMYNVLVSFGLMIVVYGIIFGVFYFYFLDKTIKKGPADFESIEPFYYLRGSQEDL
jgi:cytochrome d ubiquinol oxidase subunit I